MSQDPQIKTLLGALPSVDVLLKSAEGLDLPHALKRLVARDLLDEARNGLLKGSKSAGKEVGTKYLDKLENIQKGLRHVVNGSGVVLHTGLGRAATSASSLEALNLIADRYVNLELDLASGQRGNRHDHLRPWLRALTSAEDALLVNNNAAAVLLALNTFADKKEVISSRGQQVEIGGSFRMPVIIRKAGAKLVEVGTTNRTHAKDYQEAISNRTKLLLWVHTSNYRVEGFTKEVGLKEMVDIAHDQGLLVMADLGSGALVDIEPMGLKREPLVSEIIESGVDLVTFSVDKLLGGPQGGIICGRKELIRKIEKNNLLRALRPDKIQILLTLQTLAAYSSEKSHENLPSYRDFMRDVSALRKRAEDIIKKVKAKGITASIEESGSQIGSGAAPTEKIQSVSVVLQHASISTTSLAKRLRQAEPPILGRVKDDKIFLDLRTVREDEDALIIAALNKLEKPNG